MSSKSEPFKEMAVRIERNVEGEFAGAIVIVPPDGDPISLALFDPKKDGLAFWALVRSKVEFEAEDYTQKKQAEHNAPNFGPRR